MTDTALHPHNLAQEVQNVSTALRDLAWATRRLLVALFRGLMQHRQPRVVQSAREEANQLRAYADGLYRADPRYAQDLYAAANRHEMAAFARQGQA